MSLPNDLLWLLVNGFINNNFIPTCVVSMCFEYSKKTLGDSFSKNLNWMTENLISDDIPKYEWIIQCKFAKKTKLTVEIINQNYDVIGALLINESRDWSTTSKNTIRFNNYNELDMKLKIILNNKRKTVFFWINDIRRGKIFFQNKNNDKFRLYLLPDYFDTKFEIK